MDRHSKYEKIMLGQAQGADDVSRAFAQASHAARAKQVVASSHEQAIADVAAGVAGPALIGYVQWILRRARDLGLERLRFLSRDGQVLHLLAERIIERTGQKIDLEYVYSSRITWSLAATDPARLSQFDWLFSSFMKSNAQDLCARLGLDPNEFQQALAESGVSCDPRARADSAPQLAALRRFVDREDVAAAVAPRIAQARALLLDYTRQHSLADPATGLVDAGWTGRMVGSLIHVTDGADLPRPHIFFWGHEPRPDGWTDSDRLSAYLYNTARREGLQWRVPDAPFIIETFCMGDHGIFAGYQREPDGTIAPTLRSERNTGADAWGLTLYRATLLAVADELDLHVTGDARPLIHDVMTAFWVNPDRAEAEAWGQYPYDSDPTGTAARSLAHRFYLRDVIAGLPKGRVKRGDRAWLRGSLALSPAPIRLATSALLSRKDRLGAPPLARDVPQSGTSAATSVRPGS